MFKIFFNVKILNNYLIIFLMEIICNNEKYIIKVNFLKKFLVEVVECLI